MKKLLLTLAIAVLSFSGASPTSAASDCTLYGTGPGSENECESIEDFRCTVSNDNDITVYNDNDQAVDTGDAVTAGNTSGGSSSSGDANNSNSTVIEGTVKNNVCVTAAPVITPPAGGQGSVTPPAGGQGSVTPSNISRPAGGQGAITPVAAPQVAAPAALPNTNGASTFGVVSTLIAVLAAAVVASRLAVTTYSNLKS